MGCPNYLDRGASALDFEEMGNVVVKDTLQATATELSARAVGGKVQLLQVLGINSLKTLGPVGDVIDQLITGITIKDGLLVLELEDFCLEIDLQRVGRVRWTDEPSAWRLGDGPMPTVRLVLDVGGLEITEPSKTKRVAVWIRRHATS